MFCWIPQYFIRDYIQRLTLMTVRLRLSLPELSVWRFPIHVWKILLAVKTPWVMVIRVSVGPGPQYAYVDSSTFFQYGCLGRCYVRSCLVIFSCIIPYWLRWEVLRTQIMFTTRRSVRRRSNKEAPRWQTDANKRLNDDNNPTSPLSHCLGQEYLGMIEF